MLEHEDDPYAKLQIIEKIQAAKLTQRTNILNTFVPGNPEAKPFPEQIRFFKDQSLYRLLRCGNRGAKTFSSMRELAWILTRTHPYKQQFNVFDISDKKWRQKLDTAEFEIRYLKTKPRIDWVYSASFDFIMQTMWGQYLQKMIPDWFIKDIKYTNQKNLEKIIFRNGDMVQTRTYSQSDLAKMGAAIDGVFGDEMSPHLSDITEAVVRTFDKSGMVVLGFTPLVQNDDIRKYLDSGCENGDISLHSWSVLANPHYRDNEERKRRVLAEYSHLPENERNSRLRGDWYVETPGQSVFAGINPEIVEDFIIPFHWRRVRYTDPASYTTGHAEFAEDPVTGIWYLYLGVELSWKVAVKAETLVSRIEEFKPHKGFVYTQSIFDNAEMWFYSYAAAVGYKPCILKNREDAIMKTRDMLASGRLKLFKNGGKEALSQFNNYHFNAKGDGIVKAKDHILDCIMYFTRSYPEWQNAVPVEELPEKDYVMKQHMDTLGKRNVRPTFASYVPPKYASGFIRRTAR